MAIQQENLGKVNAFVVEKSLEWLDRNKDKVSGIRDGNDLYLGDFTVGGSVFSLTYGIRRYEARLAVHPEQPRVLKDVVGYALTVVEQKGEEIQGYQLAYGKDLESLPQEARNPLVNHLVGLYSRNRGR